MTFEIAFVLVLTAAAVVCLVREWFSADGVALGVLVALVVAGVVPAPAAVSAFGNAALVTVAGMFVLAAGLTKTHAVEFVGRRILELGGRTEARLLTVMMLVVAFISAFVNNTPLAVVFLPIVLGVAESAGIAGSKLLIPMSYATIVGGMCTLIGTSTNVLVSSVLPGYGLEAIPMFEPLPLALLGIAMTVLYMATIGRRLLPSRATVSGTVRRAGIRDYVTEVVIAQGSPLAGKTVAEAMAGAKGGPRILQVHRGEDALPVGDPRLVLREHDTLIVRGDASDVLALERSSDVAIAPDMRGRTSSVTPRAMSLAELVVKPGSPAIGQRVRDLRIHAQTGAVVLALQRHETHVRARVGDFVLRFGDVLLIEADEASLAAVHALEAFLVVEGIEGERTSTGRGWVALVIMAAVMALAAFRIERLDVWVLSLGGAGAMVATGCVGVRDAYRAVDLRLLVLMAGMIVLGQGMASSGAAAWTSRWLVDVARPLGPVGLLSAVYLATNLLTALVSNAAAALLMLPLAIATAQESHLAARPFVMAVVFAASIDFSTPIGYQTNTFVYAPGGYRFSDYVRVGGPLNLLWWALATLAIPRLWPLTPA